MPLTANAQLVLERRYLRPGESSDNLFERVANAIGTTPADRSAYGQMMADLDFLPNSPTLANAGTQDGQLSACFVLPVPDTLEGIFTAAKEMAQIQATGGGTGFSFSSLRHNGAKVGQYANGTACGPVPFMKIFDGIGQTVKQGSMRHGANMGVLRCDHPDILDFIHAKSDGVSLTNFNISVAASHSFMEAVLDGRPWNLLDNQGRTTQTVDAAKLFREISTLAHATGDPGLLFMDRINEGRANPVPGFGPLKAVNPCLAGDTLVATSSGLVRASALAFVRPSSAWTYGNHMEPISDYVESGTNPLLEIQTEHGHRIRATPYHRFLVNGEQQKTASELVPGDILPLQSEGFWPKTGPLNPAESELLGWMVGDGYVTSSTQMGMNPYGKNPERKLMNSVVAGICVGNSEREELLPRIQALSMAVLGKELNITEVPEFGMCRLGSHTLGRWALKNGWVSGWKSGTKRIPDPVLQSSGESVAGFLRGLFSADGHVINHNGCQTILTSKSRNLLEDVQSAIANFGQKSSIRNRSRSPRSFKDTKGRNFQSDGVMWDVALYGEASVWFRETVGFVQTHKRERLEQARFSPGNPMAGRRTTKIRSITPVPPQETFCLTVNPSHTMTANGVYTLNCGESPLYDYDSCNLGSINLANHIGKNSDVDWTKLDRTTARAIRFLDDVVSANKFPLPQMAEMNTELRRIGLGVMGWADLLFSLRIPYNSEVAFHLATSVMERVSSVADETSIELARERGVFPAWSRSIYKDGPKHRNSTRTTIAPTGTISIIAGCSSGIEPVFALAFKRQHKIDKNDPNLNVELFEVNPVFEAYLATVPTQRSAAWFKERLSNGESLRTLLPEFPQVAEVFVTAHDIDPESHLLMQAAFQKHTDNAVSKTINMSHTATIDDVQAAYFRSYELGLKGVTIYRDGSKANQVLSTGAAPGHIPTVIVIKPEMVRTKLPKTRSSLTHKFRVGEVEGYLTVGLYQDGRPGELFIKMNQTGDSVSGLADSVCIAVSIALQSGIPLDVFVRKYKNSRFEPSGLTDDPDIRNCTSVLDYVFRWLEMKFLSLPPDMLVPQVLFGEPCVCGGTLVMTEGCVSCPSCGYSRC